MPPKSRKRRTTDTKPIAPAPHTGREITVGIDIIAWVIVALVTVVMVLVRLRLLEVPLERDEGEYAFAGQLMLRGVPPFDQVSNMKLPGTYAAYALFFALFGETVAAVRLGLLVINLLSIALMYVLGKNILGQRGAIAATASFACLSGATALLGLMGHATHYVVLPALAGLIVYVKALERGGWPRFFGSGLLFGIAVLMKQPGIVFPLFAAAWLIARQARSQLQPWLSWAKDLAALIFGTVLPVGLTIAVLISYGLYENFHLWVVKYGVHYAAGLPLSVGLLQLIAALAHIIEQSLLFSVLFIMGLIVLCSPSANFSYRIFLIVLASFSFIGVCPGLHFREHYFLIALPAACLIIGAGLDGIIRFITDKTSARTGGIFWVTALILACLQSAWAQRGVFFEMTPLQVSRELHGLNPFPESVEISRYLKAHSRPNDRIAVLGSEPQIFFYADRGSATKYIYMYPLMEKQPYARQMQQSLIQQTESALPAYLVWVTVNWSWLARPDSEPLLLDWFEPFASRNYDVVGQVRVDGEKSIYLWDEQARQSPMTQETLMVVLRRKGYVPPA